MRALISVYDKTGIIETAKALAELGWDVVSSGGTATALREAGVDVTPVEEVTQSPEMLDGRVKTLHPNIHGGILADRNKPEHLAALTEYGIEPIDLVICNLYPFRSDPSIELIDIGGPTMVRAAAKNHDSVGIVVDPNDYHKVIAELSDRE
ncbi:MAG TPA: bifunctional phosphoribosylaminoimidazolecarboxamide formyltransferase/IMP cyclohydrolase PurH, partial [Acidimicrobiales bacterium]|nr:bifunctional phosphoribosylaminoimidazolecarboxamide formyltransferase/IMP cyclohydrolase PurH [Acidimicrobiales bacterium]